MCRLNDECLFYFNPKFLFLNVKKKINCEMGNCNSDEHKCWNVRNKRISSLKTFGKLIVMRRKAFLSTLHSCLMQLF